MTHRAAVANWHHDGTEGAGLPGRPKGRAGVAAGALIGALGLWAGFAGIVRAEQAPAATPAAEAQSEAPAEAPAETAAEPTGGAAAASGTTAEAGTTVTHAVSLLGTPKYAADFAHLDYVNPEAPKGGEFASWTVGAFDNFNP